MGGEGQEYRGLTLWENMDINFPISPPQYNYIDIFKFYTRQFVVYVPAQNSFEMSIWE